MKFIHPFHTKCEGVRACEKACAKIFFKKEDPALSAIRITPQGGVYEVNVCNQCGFLCDGCGIFGRFGGDGDHQHCLVL